MLVLMKVWVELAGYESFEGELGRELVMGASDGSW